MEPNQVLATHHVPIFDGLKECRISVHMLHGLAEQSGIDGIRSLLVAYMTKNYDLLKQQMHRLFNRTELPHSTTRPNASSSYRKLQFLIKLAANANCSTDGMVRSRVGSTSCSRMGGPSSAHHENLPTKASQGAPDFNRATMTPISSPVDKPFNEINVQKHHTKIHTSTAARTSKFSLLFSTTTVLLANRRTYGENIRS